MALELYVDRLSQPARSVVIFCRAAGIAFQEVTVNVGKGEQQKPEFLAVNPLGKVPAMKEGGFCLPESASILRYLCNTRQPGGQLADHWYPREAQARARVDSALSWHGTLRGGSMVVVWNRAVSISLKFPGNEALVEAYGMPQLQAALKALEGAWLREGPFVAGQRQVSIADLLLACEVEQLCLLDGAAQGPTMAELLAPHPRTQAWLGRVREACAPHYEEVHGVLRKSRAHLVALREQQQSTNKL